MSSFTPPQAFLKGQQKAAQIWSRNIAPNATPAISIGPNAMASLYTEKGLQSSGLSAPHLLAMARSTVTPAFGRNSGIFGRPFVAVPAMRLGERLSLRRCPTLRVVKDGAAPDRRNDAFEVETLGGSLHNRVDFQARTFGEFNSDIANTSDNGDPRLSAISLLLAASGPAAILGRIAQIVVHALDGMSIRTQTHVGFEIRERMKPAVAYFYAATAIVLKLFSSRIQAPALHSLPYVVDRIGVLEGHKTTIAPVASRHKRSKDNS